MYLQKKTNNPVLADPNAIVNANVYFNAEAINVSKNSYRVALSFSYLTDENDPSTVKFIHSNNCDDIIFTTDELVSKEGDLTTFSGTNITDKLIDMVDKLMDDHLDTKLCFDLTSADWTNV